MSEIQYCEDCEHVIEDDNFESKCKARPFPDLVHRSDVGYYFCYILRADCSETCPNFEAKDAG